MDKANRTEPRQHDMVSSYRDFIARKRIEAPVCGFGISESDINDRLFDFQKALVRWAIRRGRAGIFADTGLGKGPMAMEWGRIVAEHVKLPVLILAPLAVAEQFMREAIKFGMQITICRTAADVKPGVNVTNYQKLHKFDLTRFGGIALDEASILRALDGKTRKMLTESCAQIPYRLTASATPAPNDHTEFGGQSEFLGIKSHTEMLSTFFVHDSGKTQDWRLKGHAREAFWRWLCSWAAIVKMPSDLGYPDAGYVLPPLVYHEHIIPATQRDTEASGLLFAAPAMTLIEQRQARRGTLETRVKVCADIANSHKGPGIVWCDLNDESRALTKAIDGAIEVCGSQTDEQKEDAIERFATGKARILVSKPSVCGFGLNFQHARQVVFCGVTHSFQAFYQAVRRSYRFGVEGDVHVHVVSSELEGAVVDNLKRKAQEAEDTARETQRYVNEFVRGSVFSAERETIKYNPTVAVKWPRWLKTDTRSEVMQ